MKNKKIGILISVIIVTVLVVGVVVGYLFYSGILGGKRQGFRPGGPGGQRGNFTLTDTQINEVTDFFYSNPTTDQIKTYCQDNMGNCFYYCRTINPQHNYCLENMNNSRMRNNTYRGNYTGGMLTPPQ